jgi:hypothetical protein
MICEGQVRSADDSISPREGCPQLPPPIIPSSSDRPIGNRRCEMVESYTSFVELVSIVSWGMVVQSNGDVSSDEQRRE